MEEKKNPKVDLTKRYGLFLSIGLVFSLSFVIMAFEWKSFPTKGSTVDLSLKDHFEEMPDIPPTVQPQLKPPPVQIIEIIEKPNDEKIDDEINFKFEVDITDNTVIDNILLTDAPPIEEPDEIFDFLADNASFEGGEKEFYKFVSKNLKYPAQAQRMGVEGKVYVQFIVDKDGSLTDVHAIKGIGAGCDEEAVRVVKSSPKWNPGKQRGRAVKVRMVIPITFKLQ